MKALRDLTDVREERDQGLTLIEILVAMMIFAIIAVSVAFGLAATLRMGAESRSREVAANLAAQEIDLGRSVEKVFGVLDVDRTTVVNGTTFHVKRTTNWVTTTGADAACGSGGGQLRYKRVNVEVTWDGMAASTAAVRADSALAPGSKINDPTLGTILVSVRTANAGNAGVTVAAVPSSVPNGAATLTETPALTDGQGCSYILKVKPGNYDVTISRATSSVDVKQSTTSTKTVSVAAGAAASAAFEYDYAGAFRAKYVANYTSGSTMIPNNLETTFRSTYGAAVKAATTSSNPNTYLLYPFQGGYQAMAGKFVAPSESSDGCVSVDPAAWTTVAADGAVGKVLPDIGAEAGGNVDVDVAMGVVRVSNLKDMYLKAVSQTVPGDGDPGCALTMTYTFDKLTSHSAQVALPFGTWLITSGTTSATRTTAVAVSNLSTLTRGTVVAASGIIILDPRQVP